MADDLHPGDIRARKFRVTRRGYDRAEVGEYLDRVADRISSLEADVAGIHDRLGQLGIAELPDFKAEIDELSAEIREIMSAALAAAEGVRSRARDDAETILTDAEAASTEARGDAWESGSQLLQQADQSAEAALSQAREDALFIRAEAEQEAKRLVADARRQSDEMVRSSREQGEKIVVIAKAESEAILEGARQSAEKAQERARALENRRSELLEELEAAESAIRDLEATKAEKRSIPSVGPRVTATDTTIHWPEDEGTIRILPAEEPVPPAPMTVVDAEEMAAEVAEMRSAVTLPQPAEMVEVDIREHEEPADAPEEDVVSSDDGPTVEIVTDPEPPDEVEIADESTPAPIPEPIPEPTPEPEVAVATTPESSPTEDKTTVVEDDPGISALFAKLRDPGVAEPEAASEFPQTPDPEFAEPEEPAPAASLQSVPDLEIGEGFERRDRMLLPIENTGLRGLKRHIVELQNRVLEELRSASPDYRLSKKLVTSVLGDDLDDVLRASYGAGHTAAAESVGAKEPQLTGGPNQGAAEELALDLHRDVQAVISRRGDLGNRRLSSDVGRVFRSWRTDEAERHVRMAARRAFNDGLLAAYKRIGVSEVEYAAPGRACGNCAADTGTSWAPIDDTPPGGDIPPVSLSCAAMVVPKGSNGFDSRPGQ